MDKKLKLSVTDKKLCGVCAGIAEYFDIDPTVVRILWILFFFCGGVGLLAYLVCWAVMPKADVL